MSANTSLRFVRILSRAVVLAILGCTPITVAPREFTVTIVGTVTASSSGAPVNAAVVTLREWCFGGCTTKQRSTVVTDAAGRYLISEHLVLCNENAMFLEVVATGFVTDTTNFILRPLHCTNETQTLDIQLKAR